MLKRLFHYLNPIAQLGNKNYSMTFSFLFMVTVCVISELVAYLVLDNPEKLGIYVIFLSIALIIYFSFRKGIKGGQVAVAVVIAYYFYIIYTRQYRGEQLTAGVQTTLILALVYFILAWTIGWLKETIDILIEREANEKKRLQAILQQLPVGVMVTNRDGRVIHSNEQLDRILGTNIPSDFIISNKAPVEVYRDGELVNINELPLYRTLATGKPVVQEEYMIKRPDGREVCLQISATPIQNRNGLLIAAASIVNDVSHQKELDRRKDDFVNMASHELKTPITSMKLYIDTLTRLTKDYEGDKLGQVVNNIKKQTHRLEKLVSDLLDVSRLQTGKLSFDKESFSLDELIEETVDTLESATLTHRIEVIEKLPIEIVADRFRIYQVLTNIINNAVKYSPDGTNIQVGVKKLEKESLVWIKDQGIGISKENQEKVFERLYQVGEETEKTFPGFGMGLYISKEIIKRHNGRIWVESEKGKGSTFFFTLPLSSISYN